MEDTLGLFSHLLTETGAAFFFSKFEKKESALYLEFCVRLGEASLCEVKKNLRFPDIIGIFAASP